MWVVNKGLVVQGSAPVNTLQARALGLGVFVRRVQDWGASAWGVMPAGGVLQLLVLEHSQQLRLHRA
jgi:hypothetical protein